MKKMILTLMLVLIAGISFAGGEQDRSEAFNGPSIIIVNNTGFTIYWVYTSPFNSGSWGSPRLSKNEPLLNGKSIALQLPTAAAGENRYSIRLEDSDGDTYTKSNLSISDGDRIIFTFDDIDKQ